MNTFELIGRVVVLITLGVFSISLLWILIDWLPLKITKAIDGQKIFWEYLCNRREFKNWLKNRDKNK